MMSELEGRAGATVAPDTTGSASELNGAASNAAELNDTTSNTAELNDATGNAAALNEAAGGAAELTGAETTAAGSAGATVDATAMPATAQPATAMTAMATVEAPDATPVVPPPQERARVRDSLEAIKTAVVWLVVLQILTILSPLLRVSIKWSLIVGVALTLATFAVGAVAYVKARRMQDGFPE
jgi:hypothetical protein